MDDLPYYLAFSFFPGIGPVRFRLLMEYFGSAKSAWQASDKEFEALGLPQSIFEAFISFRKRFSPQSYTNFVHKKGVRVITVNDSAYPPRLKEIPDAPFVLYLYGNGPVSLLSESHIMGVVGTRSVTNYGKETTQNITADLVAQGFVIASGMALGVDTIAHETTLSLSGKTIAVLGCGVDIIAPPSNTSLYFSIARSGGLIISEMPLGHRPGKGLFPARNRIISGLSLGVVVTEGAENSGALITARYAAEQGREVFAVPGPITSPYSRGPARLIKNGATLVEKAVDILDQFNLPHTIPEKKHSIDSLSAQEKLLVTALQKESMQIDSLIRETKLSSSIIFSLLTKLELAGVIFEIKDQEYALR